MSTRTIDSFLQQILQSLRLSDGQRATGFLVLDLESLPPAKQQPYNELHEELKKQYPPAKDGALSTKVKSGLSSDVLRGSTNAFCEAVTSYFKYVRDFTQDSSLTKARKIEKITT